MGGPTVYNWHTVVGVEQACVDAVLVAGAFRKEADASERREDLRPEIRILADEIALGRLRFDATPTQHDDTQCCTRDRTMASAADL